MCLWLLLHTYTVWLWLCSRSLCTFGFFALPPFPRRRGGYEEASVRGQISIRRRINRGESERGTTKRRIRGVSLYMHAIHAKRRESWKNGVMYRQKKNDMIGENDGGGRKKKQSRSTCK